MKTPAEVNRQDPDTREAGTPWSELDDAGNGLTVDEFLTTILSQLINALRRTVTQPYAERFGLTVPEWRILALLAHVGQLPFAELVVQSTSDKALVSRTLRLLESRGLVKLDNAGSSPRKKLICSITDKGIALHAQVIPLARRHQAAVLRLLPRDEREALYRALRKLHDQCVMGDGVTPAGAKPE